MRDFYIRLRNSPYYGKRMYYTESEEIRIGRVRHRWAATYILFSFWTRVKREIVAYKTPRFMRR